MTTNDESPRKDHQFVAELRELLKKYDAEIWADRDDNDRLTIAYAGNVLSSDKQYFEGALGLCFNAAVGEK